MARQPHRDASQPGGRGSVLREDQGKHLSAEQTPPSGPVRWAQWQADTLALAEAEGWKYEQTRAELETLVTGAPFCDVKPLEAFESNMSGLRRLYPAGPLTIIRPREEPRHLWTIAELADTDTLPEPPSHLGADMLCAGGVFLLAGRRSVGKTYLTLWLASRLALGLDFGPYRTRAASVLFVSQEMSDYAIRKRIRKLFPDPEKRAALGRRLRIVCRVPGIKLDTPEGAVALRALIKQESTDVVILDALRQLKGGYDEQDNNGMGDLMDRLNNDVATPTRAAIVLVHHMGKPGQDGEHRGARGASTIEDAAEDICYLSKSKDGETRIGEIAKSRDGDHEGQRFVFEILSANEPDESPVVEVTVRAEGEGERAQDSEEAFSINKIRQWIEDHGGESTQQGITDFMGWKSRTTANKYLKKAEALGLLAGIGPSGKSKLWRTTTPVLNSGMDRSNS